MKKNIFLTILITISLFFISVSGVKAASKETDVFKYCNTGGKEEMTRVDLGSLTTNEGQVTVFFTGFKKGNDFKCLTVNIHKSSDNDKVDNSIKVTMDYIESLSSDEDGIKEITKKVCSKDKNKCTNGKSFVSFQITDAAINAIKSGGSVKLLTTTTNNTILIGEADEDLSSKRNYGDFHDKESHSHAQSSGNKSDKKQLITADGDLEYNEIFASSCDSLLGVKTNPDAPAYYIHTAFTWIKYVAIIILVVMSMKDFAYAVVSKDEESIKKATSICVKRFIYCIIIFLLPIIVEQVMGWAKLVDDPSICGLE